jgi:hypothetical protein
MGADRRRTAGGAQLLNGPGGLQVTELSFAPFGRAPAGSPVPTGSSAGGSSAAFDRHPCAVPVTAGAAQRTPEFQERRRFT